MIAASDPGRIAHGAIPLYLQEFGERIQIDGNHAGEPDLCPELVESARGDVMLTEFEFELAAFSLFSRAGCEAWAGGGAGRLDAVNAIDPDVSVITRIALDHQDWLRFGGDREGGKPALYGACPRRSPFERRHGRSGRRGMSLEAMLDVARDNPDDAGA